jgi:hypothetical protein
MKAFLAVKIQKRFISMFQSLHMLVSARFPKFPESRASVGFPKPGCWSKPDLDISASWVADSFG